MLSEKISSISINDFTYELPDGHVAKYPLTHRDQSKLLYWHRGQITDRRFEDLPDLLPSGAMLVFNNTRVIRARLLFRRKTGALIEIFCLEPSEPSDYALSFAQTQNCRWKCMIGNLKKWKEERLELSLEIKEQPLTLSAQKGSLLDAGQEVVFSWDNPHFSFAEILEAAGNIPIPPYLNREAEEQDLETYQTVYSKIKGSVAAPTAGLHFTDKVFRALSAKHIDCEEVTLHVGAGTFQPVKAETIGGHLMHTEHFSVSQPFIDRLASHDGKVIAVGTTSVRTLESLYHIARKIAENPAISPVNLAVSQWEAYHNSDPSPSAKKALTILSDYMLRHGISVLNTSTQIIILPGYQFRIIAGIVTNFHQPQSTLLLLISALLGDEWKRIYHHALNNGYRFLSYGDSNLYML